MTNPLFRMAAVSSDDVRSRFILRPARSQRAYLLHR